MTRPISRMAILRVIFCGLLFSIGASASARSPTARANYGALLEPADRILHGAGQSPDAFADYWMAMPDAGRPAVYMHYVGLRVRLGAVYPNPVLHTASIEIELCVAADVELEVFDVLGRSVRFRPIGHLAEGLHELDFQTVALNPGLYLARVRAGNQRATALFSKNQ